MFRLLTFLVSSAGIALAISSPPSGAITIGSGGKYSTFKAALADTSSSTYFVYAGTYTEQVYITRSNIKIYGQTPHTNTYASNEVTITGKLSATEAGNDDLSGTVRVHADGVALYNLNIENTYGHPVTQSQAIALSVYGTEFGGYGLKLSGYQDTLLAESGYQFYANSYISGAVDYIFGQTSSLWIQNSKLVSVGAGAITASGRSSADSAWYVIHNSTISGTAGTGVNYLGRPWGGYARVVFQESVLGSNIAAAGWEQWSSSNPNTAHATFAEYKNTGAGASGTRASFSSKLSSPVKMATVLGSDKPTWVDGGFL